MGGLTRGKGGVLERLLLDAMVNTVMEAMVGGSKDRLVDCMVDDGLVDGMVDDWCRLGYRDDTATHLTWKLHRDLPAFGGAELGGALFQCGRVEVGRGKLEATLFHNFLTLDPRKHHRPVLTLLLGHRGLQRDA